MVSVNTFIKKCQNLWYNYLVTFVAGIAQLVRASDCGPEGRVFNSRFPPHNLRV